VMATFDIAPKGVSLTDEAWVAFADAWRGPYRQTNTDAAADLRECLRVERPTIAGRIKGRIGDLVELAAEAVADD
jgi:hypothetical protein